ncbi:MAG: hypothetical protein KME64_00730 [Scytonematopsis contorta HA4267-MV1]|jgi:hypothetical protein|nr:hypothetical protein [Scytonematopsis contorta HA4267-MV1]
MLTTDDLTERESQIVHNLAITLAQDETDVNELGKAIAYLRSISHQPNAGVKFFKYLKTLTTNGRQIGHSGRTTDYYRSIESACNKFLREEKANSETMLKILGWAVRLMRYYKVSPIEEIPFLAGSASSTQLTLNAEEERISQRQAEITKALQSQKFDINQVLDAIVLGVKGIKVTYQILKSVKFTEKEPKKSASLAEGQKVKVKITALKEDGSIKSVKYID